jgi:hypothetical protein
VLWLTRKYYSISEKRDKNKTMIGYSIEPGGEFAIFKRPNPKFRKLLRKRLKTMYSPNHYLRIINHDECVREMEFCESILNKKRR